MHLAYLDQRILPQAGHASAAAPSLRKDSRLPERVWSLKAQSFDLPIALLLGSFGLILLSGLITWFDGAQLRALWIAGLLICGLLAAPRLSRLDPSGVVLASFVFWFASDLFTGTVWRNLPPETLQAAVGIFWLAIGSYLLVWSLLVNHWMLHPPAVSGRDDARSRNIRGLLAICFVYAVIGLSLQSWVRTSLSSRIGQIPAGAAYGFAIGDLQPVHYISSRLWSGALLLAGVLLLERSHAHFAGWRRFLGLLVLAVGVTLAIQNPGSRGFIIGPVLAVAVALWNRRDARKALLFFLAGGLALISITFLKSNEPLTSPGELTLGAVTSNITMDYMGVIDHFGSSEVRLGGGPLWALVCMPIPRSVWPEKPEPFGIIAARANGLPEGTADEFIIGDLRDQRVVAEVVRNIDEIYQFAADMGGAGYIFTGEHDAQVMHNSATINLNTLHYGVKAGVCRFFFSSSACIYPEYNQRDPNNPKCSEDSAYPAAPDSDYGWEKLFSERLYLAFMRNYGVQVRITRFHNIFGPQGTWCGGREKAPAALCRKIAEGDDGGEIEIWGDGEQTRSFLYIDDCIEGVRRLMDSDCTVPVNIGSEEMVTINQVAAMIMDIAGKKLTIKHIPGPLGVRGRNSDNRLIAEKLGWKPTRPLREGLAETYAWISQQVSASRTPPIAA